MGHSDSAKVPSNFKNSTASTPFQNLNALFCRLIFRCYYGCIWNWLLHSSLSSHYSYFKKSLSNCAPAAKKLIATCALRLGRTGFLFCLRVGVQHLLQTCFTYKLVVFKASPVMGPCFVCRRRWVVWMLSTLLLPLFVVTLLAQRLSASQTRPYYLAISF